MAGEQGKRYTVALDDEHDQVDPEAATLTALLDSIPGAWERTMEGVADAKAGRVVPLDHL